MPYVSQGSVAAVTVCWAVYCWLHYEFTVKNVLKSVSIC